MEKMLNEKNLLLHLISKECSEQFHTTFPSLLSMKLQTDPWEIKDSILNLYISHLNQVNGIHNIFILFALIFLTLFYFPFALLCFVLLSLCFVLLRFTFPLFCFVLLSLWFALICFAYLFLTYFILLLFSDLLN